MRYTSSSMLATLTICAFTSVMPAAAGNSGDANGMREQAQIHPDQASQPPDYASGFVAQGEVYPSGAVSGGHFVRSRAEYTALAPVASNCYSYKTSYSGFLETACGPQ
jgi:hypothetical protein